MLVTGNGLAFMAGRLSYTFGLTGPCVPTNTACSSSLVAAHLAAVAIRNSECSFAAAAGANAVLLPLGATAAMTQVHALAPDGRCKAFGAEADGYGRGEGFVVAMLEPAAYVTPSTHVLALFAGSAVNQDGRSSGLTAPHGPSQTALISTAMQQAGVNFLGYVASHGTGTPLGDPIEASALRRAVVPSQKGSTGSAAGSDASYVFSIGAVKSLTGHLEGSAGLAGLAQALAVLQQQSVVPLRYRTINPHVANSFENWHAKHRLPTQAAGGAVWGGHAGTSSFGMSGVNAHAILKAPEAPAAYTSSSSLQLSWQQQDLRTGMVPVGHPLLFLAQAGAAGLPAGISSSRSKVAVEFMLPVTHRPCLSWLWDHQVSGKVLMPGAGYLEMASAAARALLLAPAITTSSSSSLAAPALANVVFATPCILPALIDSGSEQAQLLLSCELDMATGHVSIRSQAISAGSSSTSEVHMQCQVVSLSADTAIVEAAVAMAAAATFDAQRAACTEPTDAAAMYRALHDAGLQYGAAFRRLSAVHRAGGSVQQAAAAAVAADAAADAASGFLVHPAVLDSVLQLGAVVPEPGMSAVQKSAMVPAALQLYRPMGLTAGHASSLGGFFTHACRSIAPASAAAVSATHRDHILFDSSGNMVCILQDLEARSIGVSRPARQLQVLAPQPQMLYEIDWVASELAAGADAAAAGTLAAAAFCMAGHSAEVTASSAIAVLQVLSSMQGLPPVLQALTQEATAAVVSMPDGGAGAARQLSAIVKGVLRAYLQETPAAVLASAISNAAASSAAPPEPMLMSMQSNSKLTGADGYGSADGPAFSYSPVLKRSLAHSAPAPYQLLPKAKGSLSSLMPVAVSVDLQQDDTVLVAVKAVGINFRDVLNVLGMYPGDAGAPGSDVAGVVMASNSSLLRPGQAVFGLAEGSLGSHVTASAQTLVPMPSHISYEAASTMPTVFITVDMVLNKAAALRPGERVLVHAAAGGVGLAALQVVSSVGATAVATAGSPSKRSLLRSLGVSAVVGSRDSVFVGPVSCLGGVDVVLNSLTSPGMVGGSLAVLRQGGRFVEIGKRDIWAPAAAAAERPDVCVSLVAVDFLPASVLHSSMSRLSAQLAAGSVQPLPGAVHDISAVAAALRQMSQARHVGKVVVSTAATAVPQLQMSPEGAVLVVGGTGTLGALVVSWLSQQSVQSIIILSRSGKPTTGLAQLLAGAASAAQQPAVSLLACDAACAADGAAFEQHLVAAQQPLLGVMHAGGILADAALNKQNLGGVRKVGCATGATSCSPAAKRTEPRLCFLILNLSFSHHSVIQVCDHGQHPAANSFALLISHLQVFVPKYSASQQLQQTVLSQPVSHQVMFSSVASLLGSPGQSNYAAANAGLDGLASQLTAAGLPAVSVQWGAWSGGGMASGDAQTAARVKRMGMSLISPAAGLAALEGVLGRFGAVSRNSICSRHAAGSVVAAVPFLWPSFLQRFGGKVPRLFAEMADDMAATSGKGKSTPQLNHY
jgi:NADPH:quinone reductase-like Zn-dependent oxidoreductase